MPLTMSQIEHAEKTINKAGKIVSNYTYPFFIIAANNKPDLVGTAVIVNYMSTNYLITASCISRTMLNTDSDRSWTPIPIQGEHWFRREGEHFCSFSGIGVQHPERFLDNPKLPSLSIDFIQLWYCRFFIFSGEGISASRENINAYY